MSLVSIIAATGRNLEIGKDNDLMWSLPRDMRFFKETTSGHPVIMGRKNWDSIPEKWRPLPGRKNIVLSRKPTEIGENVSVTNDLNAAINMAWEDEQEEIFIIGGGQIYELALDQGVVNRMYITHINGDFSDAHTFFPQWKMEDWKKTTLFEFDTDERHDYSFTICQYDKILE